MYVQVHPVMYVHSMMYVHPLMYLHPLMSLHPPPSGPPWRALDHPLPSSHQAMMMNGAHDTFNRGHYAVKQVRHGIVMKLVYMKLMYTKLMHMLAMHMQLFHLMVMRMTVMLAMLSPTTERLL